MSSEIANYITKFSLLCGVGRLLRRLKINQGNEERNIIIQPHVYELFIYMKYENGRWIQLALFKRLFGDLNISTNCSGKIISVNTNTSVKKNEITYYFQKNILKIYNKI